MSYILYNMSLKGIYDPELVAKFEEGYKTVSATHMTARIAFGGLQASYCNNQATQFGIDFWESKLEDNIEGMHAAEVLELLQAFKQNRVLHRDHIREKMDSQFKAVLLRLWNAEVVYHQRLLVGLATELFELRWFDEEIWEKVIDTATNKKGIQNMYFFMDLHRIFEALNNDPSSPMHQKLTQKIEAFVNKHYTTDRKWKYDL